MSAPSASTACPRWLSPRAVAVSFACIVIAIQAAALAVWAGSRLRFMPSSAFSAPISDLRVQPGDSSSRNNNRHLREPTPPARTACPSCAPHPPLSTATPAPPQRNPWVTQQLCHFLPDESELCVYEGPLCVSGEQVFVAAELQEGRSMNYFQDDGRQRCMDYRYFDRRDACNYAGPFQRANLDASAYEDPLKYVFDEKPKSAPYLNRKWGPDDHGERMDAVPWQMLVAATPRRAMRKLPAAWRRMAATVDINATADMRQQHEFTLRKMPTRIKWVDASAYITSYDSGWIDHPWHFATAAFSLWDAKRQNKTVENVPMHDGTPGPLNFTVGAMEMPPMDYYVALGNYDPPRFELRELAMWPQAVIPLLLQRHTKVVLNGVLRKKYKANADNWVCFTKGAVTGMKPRIFTAFGDAHAFRLMAYALSNVSTPAFDSRAPRKITILARQSRSFSDTAMVIRVVNETGLPWEIVEDLRHLTWQQQVALMSGSGILVAAHGGALANVMFMPAHSVVIEAFPYLTHFTMYQRLAEVSGLSYYKIRGGRPKLPEGTPDPWSTFDEPDFIYDCEYPHHTSSIDAMLQRACNGKTKVSPIHFTEEEFRYVMDTALDDIGCRDGVCRFQRNSGETYYRDMRTGREWTPVNAPWSEDVVDAATSVLHKSISDEFKGRMRTQDHTEQDHEHGQ